MLPVIECDFHIGDKICPAMRICCAEDAKVGFDFSIGAFGLAIGLRVVCCAHPSFGFG